MESARSNVARGVIAGAALAAAALPFASLALADAIDPSMPVVVRVGPPAGFAPSDRLDARRTGRTSVPLPSHPTETWRRQVSGGLELAPAVDADGAVLVALTAPEVMKLSADGKELWRRRLGTAPAVTPPVLTSEGGLVVVNGAGQAWGIGPNGSVRFSVPLGVKGRDVDVSPLATEDGGVVFAAYRDLIEIGADGSIRARATLAERAVGALLRGPDGVLVTTESGAVLSWRPPSAPHKLGQLGGQPRRGAALADARTLLAVVDSRRLVALDLPTGTTHVRASASINPEFFDAPVTVLPGGLALTATYGGLLLGIDAGGSEKIRVVLEKQLASFLSDAGGAIGVELRPSPPVVADDGGRVAFARAIGRVGVVSPEGAVTIVNDHLCGSPIAVVPAGPKRMAVACRDGTIWMLGD